MNLGKYNYYNIHIEEANNVVEVLHDKTDSYLELLFDDDYSESVEDIRAVMIEYITAVRSQTNILSCVVDRLQKTNSIMSNVSNATREELNLLVSKTRY